MCLTWYSFCLRVHTFKRTLAVRPDVDFIPPVPARAHMLVHTYLCLDLRLCNSVVALYSISIVHRINPYFSHSYLDSRSVSPAFSPVQPLLPSVNSSSLLNSDHKIILRLRSAFTQSICRGVSAVFPPLHFISHWLVTG